MSFAASNTTNTSSGETRRTAGVTPQVITDRYYEWHHSLRDQSTIIRSYLESVHGISSTLVTIIIGYACVPLLTHGYYIQMDGSIDATKRHRVAYQSPRLHVIRCTPVGDIARHTITHITQAMIDSLTPTPSTNDDAGATCNDALLQHLRYAYAYSSPPGFMNVSEQPAAVPSKRIIDKAEQRLISRRAAMGAICDQFNRPIMLAPHPDVRQRETRAMWGVHDPLNDTIAHWSDPNRYWCQTRDALPTTIDDNNVMDGSPPSTSSVTAKPAAPADVIQKRYFLKTKDSWRSDDERVAQDKYQQSMLPSLMDHHQWPYTIKWYGDAKPEAKGAHSRYHGLISSRGTCLWLHDAVYAGDFACEWRFIPLLPLPSLPLPSGIIAAHGNIVTKVESNRRPWSLNHGADEDDDALPPSHAPAPIAAAVASAGTGSGGSAAKKPCIIS